MANQVQPPSDDKTVEKAVWGFVGTALTWLSLFLSGMAVERLGLTSGILSGILPGETGQLRTEAEECQSNFATVKLERDVCKRSEDTLRTEISRLKAANTPAP
ncbi:MAG: hypothetical protein ACRERD_28165 [Candidatus Binatia bacterium]